MGDSDKIVWDGETAGAIGAMKQLQRSYDEQLAAIRQIIQTSERGSKDWQAAKMKESQLLSKQAAELKKLEEHAKKVGEAGKSAGDTMSKGFGAAQAVIGAIGLNQLLQKLVAYRKELSGIESAHLKAFAPLEQAAGSRSPAMRRDVGKEAVRAGLGIDQAAWTASALMREGVSREQATGATLREALTAQQVFGRQGGEQIVGLLDSQKIDITAGSIRGVAEALDGLRKASAVSDKDLASFVGEVAGAGRMFQRAGLDIPEQFATTAALKDAGVEGGASALEGMVVKLSKVGGDTASQESLARIRMTKEDVDLDGENVLDVLKKLDEHLTKFAAPGDRGALVSDILGKQGVKAGETLMEEMRGGSFQKLLDAARGGTYGKSADDALSSEGTVLQRLQTQADVAKAKKGQGAEIIRKALETELAEQGLAGPLIDKALKLFDTGLVTASPEFALENAKLFGDAQLGGGLKGPDGKLIDLGAADLKKRVLDRAKAARRPATIDQVGPADLTPHIARPAAAEYTGPSLSEQKAQEAADKKAKPPKSALQMEHDQLKQEIELIEAERAREQLAAVGVKLDKGKLNAYDKRIKPKRDRMELLGPLIRVEGHQHGGIAGERARPPGPTDTILAALTAGEEVLPLNDPRHVANISGWNPKENARGYMDWLKRAFVGDTDATAAYRKAAGYSTEKSVGSPPQLNERRLPGAFASSAPSRVDSMANMPEIPTAPAPMTLASQPFGDMRIKDFGGPIEADPELHEMRESSLRRTAEHDKQMQSRLRSHARAAATPRAQMLAGRRAQHQSQQAALRDRFAAGHKAGGKPLANIGDGSSAFQHPLLELSPSAVQVEKAAAGKATNTSGGASNLDTSGMEKLLQGILRELQSLNGKAGRPGRNDNR